jgi:6-phosphogluconolactonase
MMRAKALLGALSIGAVSVLAGCSGFFVANTTSTTPTTSATGDYVYVVNQGQDSLSEFVVGGGTLTAVSGSPIALVAGLSPASVAVTLPNTFVYVGGVGTIVAYSIGTGGALTAVSGGGISATQADFVSLDTSPDGNWLLALDSLSDAIRVYGINTSTGVLTLGPSQVISGISGAGTMAPKNLRISPNGNFVAAALGTGGVVTFTFNTSTGVLTEAPSGQFSSLFTDNAVSFDTTSAFLWVARAGQTTGTSGVATFSLNSAGVTTSVGSLAASGDAPFWVLVDSKDAFVYTANRNGTSGGTISGYTNSSGALSQMASSPFLSGPSTTALAEDNSHAFVIAASAGGAPDLTLYSFDVFTAGKLDAVATAVSGTDPAVSVALAATH